MLMRKNVTNTKNLKKILKLSNIKRFYSSNSNKSSSHDNTTLHFNTTQNNIGNFKIIESTLREGEQFSNAFFTPQQKIEIAKKLNNFGVEYIELTSPMASEQSRKDCQAITKLDLKSKILTHVRCHMNDAKVAVDCGVDGIDVVFGTSSYLREFSHGKDIPYIIESAQKVVSYIKEQGVEVRFSTEDSFRSDLVDLLQIYKAVDRLGVNRVGIADTVGVANPRQVYNLVKTVRSVVGCDIEFHGHNDCGFAIANSYAGLEAGLTHIDTSVLGIGERNGITPLGGFIAAMYSANKKLVKEKYNLKLLKDIESFVADKVQVNIPFNNYITGYSSFSHKAGIHAKAMLNNPETYEILNPSDFGMSRYIHIAHRLTGWNAIKSRAEQLKLDLTDDEIKQCTNTVKNLSDIKNQSLDDVDKLLRDFHNKKKRLEGLKNEKKLMKDNNKF